MDLKKTKIKANELIQFSGKISSYYKDIVKKLTNIYNIVSKSDPEQSKKISSLINRYNELIKEISVDYKDSVEQILNYIDNFNGNLNDFECNIANSAKELGDVLNSIDNFNGNSNNFKGSVANSAKDFSDMLDNIDRFN